ncbi:metallophosphoesterase family protein [Novisyntrophococcus fermenticellae]|uniref:metallophosphoesterase family protein n=1 Tax=Novisyntrophococcus fermenticellae TaxID=2068655 RepID=UPI001E4BBCE5|nr:metallophosphoesterase family protein [Novisyntrophococcus fermenticellae]
MRKGFHFREDGTFKIMQLTDIHYTEDDAADRQSVASIRKWIETEKPDLIMVTGDAVYGEDNLKNIEKVMAPLCESAIPWTYVFGNHDVEFNSDKQTLFSMLEKMKGFAGYDDREAIDGYGNHMLPIYAQDGKLAWVVAGIDAGNRNPLKQVGGYACVTANQIAWYQNQLSKFEKENKNFQALAFQHIPVPEIEELWRYEECFGVKRDGFGCPLVNAGQFLSMLQDGHTKGLFFGHDHLNSFWGHYYGITLGYGRKSGYGNYGAEDFLIGSRLFLLNEEKPHTFDTYEILENGTHVYSPWKYRPLQRRDEG